MSMYIQARVFLFALGTFAGFFARAIEDVRATAVSLYRSTSSSPNKFCCCAPFELKTFIQRALQEPNTLLFYDASVVSWRCVPTFA